MQIEILVILVDKKRNFIYGSMMVVTPMKRKNQDTSYLNLQLKIGVR